MSMERGKVSFLPSLLKGFMFEKLSSFFPANVSSLVRSSGLLFVLTSLSSRKLRNSAPNEEDDQDKNPV